MFKEAPRLTRLKSAALASSLVAVLVVALGCQPFRGKDVDFGTNEPGVITVAIQAYPPYTELRDGELTGLDSDILVRIAERLGMKVKVETTDFATMLAGVQATRFDISIGGIAWTAEREMGGLFSDPPYYSPPAMAVQDGKSFPVIKALEGRRLATVEDYVWVEAIDAVPGADLGAYPDAAGLLDDLRRGRIDAGFLDPLLIIDEERKKPGLRIQYLVPPTAAELQKAPAYKHFQPYMTSFYISRNCTQLEQAISDEIRKMYASGEMRTLIEKWGGDPNQFLRPSPEIAAARRGVDRPLDWQPPTI
jgi:polar amino acid transport system substrate-binding protein